MAIDILAIATCGIRTQPSGGGPTYEISIEHEVLTVEDDNP